MAGENKILDAFRNYFLSKKKKNEINLVCLSVKLTFVI